MSTPYPDLIERLAAKTSAGQAAWTVGDRQNTYALNFGDLIFQIGRYWNDTEDRSELYATMIEPSGRELDAYWMETRQDEGYAAASELFDLAKWNALKLDGRLQKLLEIVDSGETIGLQEPADDGADIPF